MRAQLLGLVALTHITGCSAADVGIVCVDDAACGDGFVCAFGQCEDPNLSALGRLDVQVEPAPGSPAPVQALLDVDVAAGAARLDLALHAGVSLLGNVRQGDVGVAAQIVARPQEAVPGRALALTGDSDTGGGFTLVGVEGTRYFLAVLPEDPALPPWYDDVGVRADPGANGVRELAPIALPSSTVTLTGRVVAGAGASLQGVPAVDVRLRVAGGPRDGRRVSSTVRTAADGAFALVMPLPPLDDETAYVLEVRPTEENEYAPLVDVPVALPVEPEPGTVVLGDVSLGVVLSPVETAVLVLDDSGSPVAGALVAVTGVVGAGKVATRGLTAIDGTVTLDTPPGSYSVVVLGPEGERTGLTSVAGVGVPLETARLTVQLPPRARCVGSIADPRLGVLATAGVAFVRVGAVDGGDEPELDGVFVGAAAVTDADGSFDVRLPPGRYRMNVAPALSAAAPSFSTVIVVEEEGLELDLTLPQRAILAGTVLFDGLAVPDAYVRVFGDATLESGGALQLGEAQAGGDGRFEIVVAVEPAGQ